LPRLAADPISSRPAVEAAMQRYGLQLRTKPAASSSSRAPPPPARPLAAFADDDDDDVEAEILRQAAKKRALQKVEEQQKKAMEEDPSVFAYDEVYDDMKEKEARPKMQDKVVRESKYIAQLKEKAEQRKREQDIIYERKLQKERSKEDHLFGDKDKFVTSAYRKKLEEQQKWLEEERLRQLREEREDVSFLHLFAVTFRVLYTYTVVFISTYFYYFFQLFPCCMFASDTI